MFLKYFSDVWRTVSCQLCTYMYRDYRIRQSREIQKTLPDNFLNRSFKGSTLAAISYDECHCSSIPVINSCLAHKYATVFSFQSLSLSLFLWCRTMLFWLLWDFSAGRHIYVCAINFTTILILLTCTQNEHALPLNIPIHKNLRWVCR